MSTPERDPELRASAATKADLLGNTVFELIPMKTTLEKARLFSPGSSVSVTASPTQPMSATVDVSERLARLGLEVVPHVSARLTKSRSELAEIVERLRASEIDEIFVVGGDTDDPGEFFDAMALLDALTSMGSPFGRIGIAGYPEGHPDISDDALMDALIAKAPYASSVTTQMCFDAASIERWVRTIRNRGVTLPVLVGVPGVTDLTKLMSISARIGVGTSLRFLSKNRGLAGKLLRPYSPDTLVDSIAGIAGDPSLDIVGLHVYTFNQVEPTLQWFRQAQPCKSHDVDQ